MSEKHVERRARAKARGEVTVELRRDDGDVRRMVVRNTITYGGLNGMLRLLAQATITPSDFALRRLVPGTNGTPPTPGDLALGAPVGPSDQIVLTGANFTELPASREIIVTGTLATGQANGQVLREIGLAFQNGTLYARQVHPAFEKDGTLSVTYTWRLSVTA